MAAHLLSGITCENTKGILRAGSDVFVNQHPHTPPNPSPAPLTPEQPVPAGYGESEGASPPLTLPSPLYFKHTLPNENHRSQEAVLLSSTSVMAALVSPRRPPHKRSHGTLGSAINSSKMWGRKDENKELFLRGLGGPIVALGGLSPRKTCPQSAFVNIDPSACQPDGIGPSLGCVSELTMKRSLCVKRQMRL
ncbi:hypothetical protein EYF80_027056 [Liparis tanakae]|uniref:Uncharacterized protein n=1 Tax=Liparis tanakae TaxID=230148 RepID=A0A4Z2HCU7_9TELE|nr:hypothetical protein EYF80_027056 [Liparis tanakae]